MIIDAAIEDVGVMVRLNLPPPCDTKRGGVLTQRFDLLLRSAACLLDQFRAFRGPGSKFFRLSLDFRMQSLKYRDHRCFKFLLGFEVHIGDSLAREQLLSA